MVRPGKCGKAKPMKVLVTGSGGYIGTQLVQVLTKAGHEVTGLDTDYFGKGWLYGKPFSLPTFIKKDIRKVEVKDVKGFNAVIHLAELSNDPLGTINEKLTYDINHNGTVKLINACKEAGVPRFIYSSSCTVYGASDEVRDETSPTNALTPYGKCKVLNEDYLLKNANPMTAVIFRNATVYGASPRMRFDLAVNNLAGLAWTTAEVKMDSDGTPWRPFVHILDVCQAFLMALTVPHEQIHKQIINVGDSHSNYQIKEIAEIIGRVFKVSDISLNKQGADKRNYKVNFDKITRVLPGFKCERNVEIGALELLEIFKSINMTKDTFFAKEFTRLKMVDHLVGTGKLDSSFYWTA